jgi:hypothetical protein
MFQDFSLSFMGKEEPGLEEAGPRVSKMVANKTVQSGALGKSFVQTALIYTRGLPREKFPVMTHLPL